MAAMLSRCGEFQDPDHSKRNFSALNEQRNSSRFCDIVLRVCNTEINAHANVLAASSPYFDSFLGSGNDCPRTFSQKQPQIIEIHIDSVMMVDGDGGYGEAVSKVVDYMYTSEITLTTTLVSQIIEIGKIMLLDKLLGFCTEFQQGINDNKPCNVSTCTSGLQEVASLLSTQSRKIIKRVHASTETDEELFAKLRCLTPVSFENETNHNLSENTLKASQPTVTVIDSVPDSVDTNSHLTSNFIVDVKQSSSDSNVHENTSIFESLDQSSVSVTMAELENDVAVGLKSEEGLSEPQSFNSKQLKSQTHSGVDSLENFNTLESFAEILNVHSPKVFPVTQDLNDNDPHETADWPSQGESENTKSKESDEVAVASDDLIPFDSFSSSRLKSSTQRGRSRGRRRRGRRGGRPPGRPRKVKDPESDPEFDEFMKRLEKGDGAKEDNENPEARVDDPINHENTDFPPLNPRDSSVREDPDYVPINAPKTNILTAPEGMWKSPRVRSKPHQLKKDYILHSLSRKTRRPHGVSSLERITVHNQVTKRKSNPSVQSINSLRFVCHKCDFSTSVFRDYKRHLKCHPETDPRYFSCPKCDFKTVKSRIYTSHKQMHMAEELVCVYCEHQASTVTEYDEHNAKHSGEFPYFCTECDSKFRKKNQLMYHKPKHQLEKPFVCAICNSGFKWKHALKNHMITHSRTKDHLCDVCGYATAHKSQLKAHKLIHTGQTFKCSIQGCQFEATKRQKLKYHMVTHTHEKPHQCDVCGQRFSLNKNMRRHMLLHTNFRPYACKMCSFTTTRYDKLKEHNFKLHNIGGAPVPKKMSLDLIGPNVTYVKSESITLNPDGTFSEEALQKIAQFATSQQVSAGDQGDGVQQTTINIEQPPIGVPDYPIIARVQYSQVDESGIQYVTEIPGTE